MKALLLLILPLNLWAHAPVPTPPSGWIQMNSLSPVILTWVYGNPEKELKDVPSFTIQKFGREEKFVSFIQKNSPDKNQCASFEPDKKNEWFQVWCIRPKSVVNLMWKNGENEEIKKTLLEWVLTHE